MTLQLDDLRQRLAVDSTRQMALVELGDWVKETCLMAGSGAATAQIVAALMVAGLMVAGLDQRETKPNNFWTIK